MFRVTREFEFCYGHRLLDYDGKCAHPHGHNGRVIVTVETNGLNDQGMVLDFCEIKEKIGSWIDTHIDHRMILSTKDPLVPLFEEVGEPVYLIKTNPTAENLAKLIYDQGRITGLPIVEVVFWETQKCCATYTGEVS